jgi:formate-dependent nitrite reductase membrane component NrfD
VSDTFFTSSPHWGLWIVLYFFVGGIAGGSLFLAGMLRLLGGTAHQKTVRAGFRVALVGALLSGLLLTIDLDRPLRFWHMLIQSNTGALMFKGWSPMSVGAWGLVGFSLVAFLGTLGELGSDSNFGNRWRRFQGLGRGAIGVVIAALAIGFGLFLAGYTGVLLAVTNRPIWADSPWLGAIFVLSGISAGAATLFLLGRDEDPTVARRLALRIDRPMLVLEFLAILAFLVSLGPVAKTWLGWNGVLLGVGVLGAGIATPLTLYGREAEGSRRRAALLVLTGGLLLRFLVIVSSNRIP